MSIENYIVATAGHIDHGKSTLVEALSGVNPDRLPEEKKRGMTIDLGFAHLLISRDNQDYSLGVIDVPGHADFIKNMVAGLRGVDLALLVVACDDGWMPQTEEHLQILEYSGVKNGLIVLTKSDVTEDDTALQNDIRNRVAGSFLETAEMVPVSALGGEGLEELKDKLGDLLARYEKPKESQKPRLDVDRVFSPKGVGTVVTGTLTGGQVQMGDKMVLAPQNFEIQIRGIQNHLSQNDTATPGMRTALNIPELEIDEKSKKHVKRGNTVVGKKVELTDTIEVYLYQLDRSPQKETGVSKELKNHATVNIHMGSQMEQARVNLINHQKELTSGQETIAQLRFEKLVFVTQGDRLIVRDTSKKFTLAGGIILNVLGKRKGFHSEEKSKVLMGLAQAIREESASDYLMAFLGLNPIFPLDKLINQSCFIEEEIKAATKESEEFLFYGNYLINQNYWLQRKDEVLEIMEDYHKKSPAEVGISNAELEEKIDLTNSSQKKLMIKFLEEEKLIKRVKDSYAVSTHQISLPEKLTKSAGTIKTAFERSEPLLPPSLADVLVTELDREAMAYLLETGEMIRLDEKAIITRAGFQMGKNKVIKFLNENQSAKASEMREMLNTSRRILIPFLECLDDEGITKRVGDQRELR